MSVKRTGDELAGRVNCAELPPGDYEFRVSATDVAGNTTASTKRANGEPMILTFPLRTPVTLEAHLGGGAGEDQHVGYDAGVDGRGPAARPGRKAAGATST